MVGGGVPGAMGRPLSRPIHHVASILRAITFAGIPRKLNIPQHHGRNFGKSEESKPGVSANVSSEFRGGRCASPYARFNRGSTPSRCRMAIMFTITRRRGSRNHPSRDKIAQLHWIRGHRRGKVEVVPHSHLWTPSRPGLARWVSLSLVRLWRQLMRVTKSLARDYCGLAKDLQTGLYLVLRLKAWSLGPVDTCHTGLCLTSIYGVRPLFLARIPDIGDDTRQYIR